MSLHGIQKFLPYIIGMNGERIELPADYAVGLKNCLDRKKKDESLVNFSRLAWPFILIQGNSSSHIVFDDVGICNLDEKIINPPRQATIGHILRNIDNKTYEDMLEMIKSVILYSDEGKKIKSDNGKEEEVEEFKIVKVDGLIKPELIDGVAKLIPQLKNSPISEYALLESVHSVESALNLSQNYKDFGNLILGNKVRWNTLKELIQGPFDSWLTELKVKIKDAELIYKSTITKEESSITADSVTDTLDAKKDSTDQWAMQEKKNILAKIGGSFVGIDQILDELRKENTFFLNTDSFKLLKIEDAINTSRKHLDVINEACENIKERAEKIRLNIDNSLAQIKQIENESDKRIRNKTVELRTKLAQRNTRIQSVSEASESYITDLKDAEQFLHDKLLEIHEIIDNKMSSCEKDMINFQKWGLSDEISKINLPVLRIFMPLYIALFEDEEEDERIVISLPTISNKNLDLEHVNEGFKKFSEKIETIIEDDMKIRSNFEFTMDRLNLLKNDTTEKKIRDGFDVLKIKGFNIDGFEKYIATFLDAKNNL